ncbi:MAG: hypothetical protein JW939_04510 [Candidatus Thermoplasmatota archaeon]|nr:hypothetical protein [Candidatus Thermoplasmatota archaeon]
MKMELKVTELWEDYNISISIWNVGKDPVDLADYNNSNFTMIISGLNDKVMLVESITQWGIGPIKGLDEGKTKNIEPGEKMELNFTWFTGVNIYQIYDNETIVPYGEYKVLTELVVENERFANIVYIDHTPVIEMSITGQTIDRAGHFFISLTNTRDYALDFILPYPGLTETKIYDSNGRLVAGGSGRKPCMSVPWYIGPHQTVYENGTFISDLLHETIRPGGYHIISLCLVTPFINEAWIFFR